MDLIDQDMSLVDSSDMEEGMEIIGISEAENFLKEVNEECCGNVIGD